MAETAERDNSIHNSEFARKRLKKRYGKERRFRMWGVAHPKDDV